MANEGSSENQDWLAVKNWRNAQKEREREKRRMRDRERRQSMSLEERERHLARRRRNYQLRRQRALSAAKSATGFDQKQQQVVNNGSELENENAVAVAEPVLEMQRESAPTEDVLMISGVEARIRVRYPYPKGLHFYQIRHLARLLNTRSREVDEAPSPVITKSSGNLWRRMRLIDIKRLARALNSVPKGLAKSSSPSPSSSGERIEQIICSNSPMLEESNEEVHQEVNAYSGVFAP